MDYLPGKSLTLQDLTVQEKVLVQGMHEGYSQSLGTGDDVAIRYTTGSDGARYHSLDLTQDKLDYVMCRFKQDPKSGLAVSRNNLLNIARNTEYRNPEDRVRRYLSALVTLNLRFDRQLFPPTSDEPILGIPSYLPDGLSDMGSDDRIDTFDRDREKIRVRKDRIYEQSKRFLSGMIMDAAQQIPAGDSIHQHSTNVKHELITGIANFVYNHIKYDYCGHALGVLPDNRSIGVDEFFDIQMGVCRHHAIYTQVLSQFMGLTSRLFKCNVSFDGRRPGAHASNLIRVNNRWHLLDVTNPDEGEIFLREIPNENSRESRDTFSFKTRKGTRDYFRRTNMYYRIKNNQADQI